jgi:hypothetical protein
VSKMVKRIKPIAPMIAKAQAKPDKTFCVVEVLWARRPLWRNQRSETKHTSNMTTETAEPAMKRGWRFVAPMSEMYAIVWPGSMLT